MEIKCIGVTRCCRQKMLEKMNKKEAPFQSIKSISLIPSEYKGRKTMQLFVNDVDIGFIPPKQFLELNRFIPEKVINTVKYSPTGRAHYDCIISGNCIHL